MSVQRPGSDDPRGDTKSVPCVTNSLGMQLVSIPAGEFTMGNHESTDRLQSDFPAYEPERMTQLVDELPVHRVRISRPFYFGQHQVTIGQFAEFVRATDYQTEAERDGTGGYGYSPELGDFEGRKPQYSWRNVGFPQAEDHPVVNLSWHDAQSFCRWLSGHENRIYRLPTEAEWEYACRAGTTSRYHSGDEPETLVEVANLFDAQGARALPAWSRYALAADDGFSFTAPVGSFRPNAFGLCDMHGNVWEWCHDWYSDSYYAGSASVDPMGPPSGRTRVRRGGAWHSWPLYVRSSFRNFNTPESRYLNLGLRVVMEER